eukprot:4972856-Prymnesium_polylepis.1
MSPQKTAPSARYSAQSNRKLGSRATELSASMRSTCAPSGHTMRQQRCRGRGARRVWWSGAKPNSACARACGGGGGASRAPPQRRMR